MTWRQIAIIVGPAIALMVVALVAMALGYGEMVGPPLIIAAAVWVIGRGLAPRHQADGETKRPRSRDGAGAFVL